MSFCEVIEQLYKVIENRKKEPKEGSYTSSLFKKGEDRILQKLGEESIEAILAIKSKNKEHAVYEVSDLIYHLLVALVEAGITLDDVAEELSRRRK